MQQTKLTPADITSAPEIKDPITGESVRSNPQPLAPKDWAVNLLLFAYMSEFPDPIEYSIWVHKVAFAGKIGDEAALTKLESEMTELARGHVRRANDKVSDCPPNS